MDKVFDIYIYYLEAVDVGATFESYFNQIQTSERKKWHFGTS